MYVDMRLFYVKSNKYRKCYMPMENAVIVYYCCCHCEVSSWKEKHFAMKNCFTCIICRMNINKLYNHANHYSCWTICKKYAHSKGNAYYDARLCDEFNKLENGIDRQGGHHAQYLTSHWMLELELKCKCSSYIRIRNILPFGIIVLL